ncbi:MAG: cobaltochelatase subunit CobT, partial [Amylibacter sp.]
MSKPNDNPADPFKKALAEATRAMANDAELNVAFSVDPPGVNNEIMRLPQISRRMSLNEVLLARGTADAFALRKRFNNETTHNRYMPEGIDAREIYEVMATARCEAVGAKAMPGTAGNIDAKMEAEALKLGYDQVSSFKEVPMPTALGYYLRHMATGREMPPAVNNAMKQWQTQIEERSGDTFKGLEAVMADQVEFAKFARQLIDDLGFGDQLGDDPDDIGDDNDDSAEQEDQDYEEDTPDTDAGDQEEESDEFDDQQDQQQSADQQQSQVSMDERDDMDGAEEVDAPDGEAPLEPPTPPAISDADPNYRVFTTEYDEEEPAEELAEPAELERLRAYLDQQLEPLKGAVSRLANKLQRRLQ